MNVSKLALVSVGLCAASAWGQGLWLAEASADSCDFELALSQWSRAGLAERQSFDGRLLRARILIQLGRGTEAVAEVVALRKLAPDQRVGDVLFALALAQSAAREFAEAEVTLAAAREKGVDKDLVEAAIAELRLSSGRTAEAESMLRRLLRRSPELTGPTLNLAVIRAREGNLTEAAALIRFAWQLGYQNPRELRSGPDFAQVRASGLLNDLISTPVGRCTGFY